MKIIPGDRLGNKGFIQKSAHLLQSKQSTQLSPRTCYLLYSSTSSLGLSLSPHFINHSLQKSHHPNIICFQFVFGVIQKLNMAHHGAQGRAQSAQPNSQSLGWDVPAQPHNSCAIPKPVLWLWPRAGPQTSPVHVTYVEALCYITSLLLPRLWVFGKSFCVWKVLLCLENPAVFGKSCCIALAAFTTCVQYHWLNVL